MNYYKIIIFLILPISLIAQYSEKVINIKDVHNSVLLMINSKNSTPGKYRLS